MVYCDVFRAIPAIVVILLVVFGLPLTGVKFFQTMPTVWLGIIALTLTYTAYVSEVYRAGLVVDPPQPERGRPVAGPQLRADAADGARAAGGAAGHPAAAQRLHQPAEGHRAAVCLRRRRGLLVARAVGGKLFNLSPITLVAFLFIVITIPQARFVDWLIDRDARRRAGGS